MRLLYFAWFREKIGTAEEVVDPPAGVRDVAALLAWLPTRGKSYADALAEPSVVRVAVNQEYAGPDTPVGPADEVALFPPVTGG